VNPISPEIKTGTVGELLVQLRLLQFDVQAAQPLKATVAGSFSFAKVEERYYRRIMHDLRESPKLTDNFAETSRLVLSTITSGILKEDSLSPSRFRTSFWKRLLLPGRTKPGWRDSTESPVTLPG
jgi:hypothetical protein